MPRSPEVLATTIQISFAMSLSGQVTRLQGRTIPRALLPTRRQWMSSNNSTRRGALNSIRTSMRPQLLMSCLKRCNSEVPPPNKLNFRNMGSVHNASIDTYSRSLSEQGCNFMIVGNWAQLQHQAPFKISNNNKSHSSQRWKSVRAIMMIINN